MHTLSLTELAAAVKGRLFVSPTVTQSIISKAVTDSRTYFKGSNPVFFALIGPSNNGHRYILQLQEKGMQVFVVSDKSAINKKGTFILVDNTKTALQNLAAFTRNRFKYPVIGITGSNGKTIIKEWLHDILSSEYKIVRSPKSYNSQVGVPLSVLLMNDEFDLGIFEAGISEPGEMKNLEEIISPNIGVLTNIGDAHQENFVSTEQKLNEKLQLFKNCKSLVFRTDNDLINRQANEFCKKHKIEKINWTLENRETAIRFSAERNTDNTQITAFYKDKTFKFTIPFTDDSAIENACHCFAYLLALPENPEKYISKFAQLQPIAMRLEIKQGINNCLLINDYYNSDLNSLTIALSVLQQQAAKEHLHKQVILSDIQQTGLDKEFLYKKVDELFRQWGIDRVIGIGPDISAHKNAFTIDAEFYHSRADFEERFLRNKFNSSVILIKGARQFEFEKISGLLQQKAHQTVLEINLNALINNLTVFKNLLKPETKIMVMVKAFSYGSGDVEIARLLQYQNVDYLAVAVADEGVQLRNAGITVPIIVMNPEQNSFQNIIDYHLQPNIYSLELLVNFTKAVSVNGLQNFPVHLKIDTGMNRLGLKTKHEISEIINSLKASNRLTIQSVFSHLAGSDDPELDEFTHHQFEQFEKCFEFISKSFPYKIDRHILNSAGIERFPEKQYNMVRLGIGLYGISQTDLPLENIGTLKSTISQVKSVKTNETVGYNRKGKVNGRSKIAVVPIGYADGLDRKLSNRNGQAFVNGNRVPIIGNICMDMLMLDVSGTNAKPGDTVEFFGPNISITELAEKVGTIPYEILTGISQRVKRIYVQE
ncbi:bifunctional UDP-N-acetylmuramoyl-tripeptide:D-alanyl-D-alanine ligase/alanine racemase [Prolixibacteraceae bacterium Z1-6]|uniref:Alanine racemase n=1 Tax=Draconibacterium aestuarii TaxID=2998507 RepID=A0A9X3J2Y9_9BACT|nr:bifunctional UDP-N-acetylmuramoyl-tripeptide:D-alanyl-D-alanine ligase/alanine racemase [Prolixibacteraceae bacterium Z1-6]